jgi:hypothetical protein
MVISFNGTKAPNIFAAPTAPEETSSESIGSFTDQLSSALGNEPAAGSGTKTPQGQDSGARQIPAVAADAGSAVPPAPVVSAPSIAGLAADGLENAPLDEATRASLSRSEINAYWDAQPSEVQQLRNVADFGARSAMAQDLADKGYTIDRAIMVWGWDPMKTMATRSMYGYTWVPNMNQATPSTGPAFALDGQTPYDPKNPPPGSIAVNTDFAKGLGITDPWAI